MAKRFYEKVDYKGEAIHVRRSDGRREAFDEFKTLHELEKGIQEFTNGMEYEIYSKRGHLSACYCIPIDDFIPYYKLSEKYNISIEMISYILEEVWEDEKLIDVLEKGFVVYQMNDYIQANHKFEREYGLSFKNREYNYFAISEYSNGKPYYVFYDIKNKIDKTVS